MARVFYGFIASLTLLLATACSTEHNLAETNSDESIQFKEIGWPDLEKGIDQTPQEPVSHEPATFEDDTVYEPYGQLMVSRGYPGMGQQAYSASHVVAEMDGRAIRIPGFIVPIEFEGHAVSEFFLVPYFGACYHLPPPPPNQIIYVASNEALEIESIYDPVWVEGIMSTQKKGNEIATAAYSLALSSLEEYTY